MEKWTKFKGEKKMMWIAKIYFYKEAPTFSKPIVNGEEVKGKNIIRITEMTSTNSYIISEFINDVDTHCSEICATRVGYDSYEIIRVSLEHYYERIDIE